MSEIKIVQNCRFCGRVTEDENFCTPFTGNVIYVDFTECYVCMTPVCLACSRNKKIETTFDTYVRVRFCPNCAAKAPKEFTPAGVSQIASTASTCQVCGSSQSIRPVRLWDGSAVPKSFPNIPPYEYCSSCRKRSCPACISDYRGRRLCQSCSSALRASLLQCPLCNANIERDNADQGFNCQVCKRRFCWSCRVFTRVNGRSCNVCKSCAANAQK